MPEQFEVSFNPISDSIDIKIGEKILSVRVNHSEYIGCVNFCVYLDEEKILEEKEVFIPGTPY